MENFLVEKLSRSNVDKTVEMIIVEAEKNGWKVPIVHDLQQTLAKNGKIVLPVKVIELCKPEYSGKLLELNHERAVSVMMPCRISVYEKEDGRTFIALLNMEAIADGMPQNIVSVMSEAARESEFIIESVLQ